MKHAHQCVLFFDSLLLGDVFDEFVEISVELDDLHSGILNGFQVGRRGVVFVDQNFSNGSALCPPVDGILLIGCVASGKELFGLGEEGYDFIGISSGVHDGFDLDDNEIVFADGEDIEVAPAPGLVGLGDAVSGSLSFRGDGEPVVGRGDISTDLVVFCDEFFDEIG